MQRRWVCAVLGVPFTLLSAVSLSGQGTPPAQARIETAYPRHAARGQTTVINVAVPSREPVHGAEVSPATGVTVSSVKGTSSETEQAIGWWEVTLDVAKDAAPGDRSLVLLMKMGRTVPTTISIPTHTPTISNLTIAPVKASQDSFEMQLTAADTAGDVGASPYVWFMADCGGEPIAGAVRGRVSAGSVRATVPNLRKVGGEDPATAGKCDVQVRITDSMGIDSNTLKSTIEFTN